ncbi:MAG: DUF4328 domain-containing protein [Pseudonocardia sp.]|nr:DUF4328 domain-containing protein [Pseudonocardia sp.]
MTRPPVCSRCGRTPPPGSGPFCPYCGRYLAALVWVAEPPPSAQRPPRVFPRPPYAGPPRYPFVPRWGFPAAPWRTDAPDPPPSALPGARMALSQLVPLLWITAVVAAVAAGAEIWRYVLLLASRSDALSMTAVRWSDGLVRTAGWASVAATVLSGVVLILWSLRAAQAAGERTSTRPSRTPLLIVLGWLVPGYNLSAPGSLLAEIEHAGLDRAPDTRPRPSRLVLLWWGVWALGAVLGVVTVLWSFRTGAQARADGVVLHALLDVTAVATAMLTLTVTRRLTALLGPPTGEHREILVAVRPPAEPAAT